MNRVLKINNSLGRPSGDRHSKQGVAKYTVKNTNNSIVHAKREKKREICVWL